jgi:hypothetical protein
MRRIGGTGRVHIMQPYGWGKREYECSGIEIADGRVEIELKTEGSPSKAGPVLNFPQEICIIEWGK